MFLAAQLRCRTITAKAATPRETSMIKWIHVTWVLVTSPSSNNFFGGGRRSDSWRKEFELSTRATRSAFQKHGKYGCSPEMGEMSVIFEVVIPSKPAFFSSSPGPLEQKTKDGLVQASIWTKIFGQYQWEDKLIQYFPFCICSSFISEWDFQNFYSPILFNSKLVYIG